MTIRIPTIVRTSALAAIGTLLVACTSVPKESFYSDKPFAQVRDCISRELSGTGQTAAVIKGSTSGYKLADNVVLDAGIRLTEDPPGTRVEYHFQEGKPANPAVDNALANCT